MSSDLRDLYQSVILDHNRHPRNFGKLEGSSHEAEGYNPLCGDKVKVYLRMAGDVVEDVSFEGSGCAISTASASLLTDSAKGKKREEVERLFRRFRGVVMGENGSGAEDPPLGKLEVLAGVREFPMRVKCATLVWHTLMAAFEQRNETVSTE